MNVVTFCMTQRPAGAATLTAVNRKMAVIAIPRSTQACGTITDPNSTAPGVSSIKVDSQPSRPLQPGGGRLVKGVGKRDGPRCDLRRCAYPEFAPTPQSGRSAVRRPRADRHTAHSAWCIMAPHIGRRQRPQQAHHAADHPYEQHQVQPAQRLRESRGLKEDSRSDHRADDDRRRPDWPQDAQQLRFAAATFLVHPSALPIGNPPPWLVRQSSPRWL